MWFLYIDSWTQHSEQEHCLERQNFVIVPFLRMFLSHMFLLMLQNIAVETFLVPLEQIPDTCICEYKCMCQEAYVGMYSFDHYCVQ